MEMAHGINPMIGGKMAAWIAERGKVKFAIAVIRHYASPQITSCIPQTIVYAKSLKDYGRPEGTKSLLTREIPKSFIFERPDLMLRDGDSCFRGNQHQFRPWRVHIWKILLLIGEKEAITWKTAIKSSFIWRLFVIDQIYGHVIRDKEGSMVKARSTLYGWLEVFKIRDTKLLT